MRIRFSLKKIYVYLVLLLILYTSDSIYTYVFIQLDHEIEIIADILMLMSMFFLSKEKILMIFECNGFLSSILLLVSLYNLKNTEYLYLIALLIRFFAVSTFIVWCYDQKIDFLSYLCTIVFFMAIFYLFCYVLFDMGVSGVEPKIVKVAGFNGSVAKKSIYGCYCGFYYRWDFTRRMLGYKVMACNGFFREVGVYQIYLNFAIFWYMYMEKGHEKRVFFLILAVISTFSAMGFLILACMIAVKLLNKSQRGVLFGLLSLVVITIMMYGVMNDKIVHYAHGRQSNLKAAISWLERGWPWGNGYSRDILSWYGLLNYVIHFGIVGFIPIVLLIIGITKGTFGKNWKAAVSCIIWWGLCLMNEAAGYSMFFLVIYVSCFLRLFMGISYDDIKHEKYNV